MQDICQLVLRNLCCCLIRKTNVEYHDVNEEGNKFLSMSENMAEDNHTAKNQSSYIQNSLSPSISSKIAKFITEEDEQDIHRPQHQNTLIEVQHGQQKKYVQNNATFNTYSDVISEDHPYYHLFKDKVPLLNKIFQIPSQAQSIKPETQYPLQIYCYQEGKYNIFKYFFTLPTDYHSYEAISNDFQLQKQFDNNIQQFKKILETPGGDAKLIYLSYKKVLIMSSRDFQYVRYTFKKGNQFWNICVSDMSREEIVNKVRGEMVLTVTRVIQKGGQIQISVSSQTDMKIPIKLQMAKNRGFAQIRKYLDKIYNNIKQNEQNKSII